MLANTLASSGAGGGDCLADLRAVRWLPNACCPDAYGRCVSASDISQALAAEEGCGGRRAGSWYSSPQSRVCPALRSGRRRPCTPMLISANRRDAFVANAVAGRPAGWARMRSCAEARLPQPTGVVGRIDATAPRLFQSRWRGGRFASEAVAREAAGSWLLAAQRQRDGGHWTCPQVLTTGIEVAGAATLTQRRPTPRKPPRPAARRVRGRADATRPRRLGRASARVE
jgi:hypothetical protein